MRPCFHCSTVTYDHNLADAIAQNLKLKKDHWPSDWMKEHTPRDVMLALGTMGEYTAFKGNARGVCRKHKNTSTSTAPWFQEAAYKINKSAEGLCYTCTREDKHATQCEHKEKLE